MRRGIANSPIPFTLPMECAPVRQISEGEGWVYELKLDGFRGQAIRDQSGVRLYSRNGKDFTRKYPQVVASLTAALRPGTVLDGELVAFDLNGRPSFAAMQDADAASNVVFFAFDVLMHECKDTQTLLLSERLGILRSAFTPSDLVQHCEHFAGPFEIFLAGVRKIGGEGVVAKRLSSRYEPAKRSGAWKKMRINVGQEFVIGGFTPGSSGVDTLVVGFYEGRNLLYAARVRAGFVPSQRRDLYARLKPIIAAACPFANLPELKSGRWGQGLTADKMRDCIWVQPKLVANFEFLEWTDSNHVRHIKFVALRSDKAARRVIREA